MVFTSFNFLIFFFVFVIIYFITPSKYKAILLLAGSYFFYINTKPVYALLLAGVTSSTFYFTNLIAKNKDESKKRTYKTINIVLILLPLFFFKYFGAINNGLSHLLQSYNMRWPLPEMDLLLPVGISFYTFMAIGYTVDVYNEDIEVEKDISIVALFISFFPLILSGPIERAKNMIPQFKRLKNPDYSLVVIGMKWMLWGFFMKLVVADRMAIYIDTVFSYSALHNGNTLLLVSFLYPFQVYADLGGYSLIAIGIASVLGINVMQNFKRPFFSTSMAELWRRWHISLISWLTDYVYTPLSFTFRRYKIWGIVMAIMVTFIISGIWHGAALTFVVWGLIQGIYLSVEALTSKRRKTFELKYNLVKKPWYIFFQICVTIILLTASQIFGRAENINNALDIYRKIFTVRGPLFIGATPSTIIYAIVPLLMLLIKDFTDEFVPTRFLIFENRYKAVRITAYASVIIIILLLGVFDGGQFLYFKF